MFKSINRKYVAVFLAIVFISFAALTVILISMVNDYSVSKKKSFMDDTAESISASISMTMRMSGKDFERIIADEGEQLKSIFDHAAKSNDAIIFVTDTEGNMLLKSNDTDNIIPAKISSSVIKSAMIDRDDYVYSDIDGTFPSRYMNHISPIYIAPVKPLDLEADSSEVMGILFICSGNWNLFLDKLGGTFIVTLIWIFLVTVIAIYFICERITMPLREISRAAKSFAKGEFDVRVPVHGNDEIAELAIAFNNMARSLEKIEENRSIFLSNVSHDLRTPMTTISGFIDGILTGAIPPEKHEHYLGIIASEIKRLSRLVSSLLDITRLQGGERKFNFAPFDVCEMARMVLISCEKRIDEKKLDVEFVCDEDSMTAVADYDAIYQIMYNLVDNAIKFSDEKGELKVHIIYSEKKVFVSVRNTGAGIPKDELPYVFEQFYKTDKSRGLDKTGLGLGLYICKTIIDKHNEEMWVKSEEGSWVEFVFSLARK